jgi:hypothetical protein
MGSEKEWLTSQNQGECRIVDQGHPLMKREQRLRALTHQFLFSVERAGKRSTLTRTADVSKPVRHKALTLGQAEDLLSTWNLRGFDGG